MELKFLTKYAVQHGTRKAFAGKYKFYISTVSGILLGLTYVLCLHVYYGIQPFSFLDFLVFLVSTAAFCVIVSLLSMIPIEMVIAFNKKSQRQYLEKLTEYNEGLKEALVYFTNDGWIKLMKENPESYNLHVEKNLPAYRAAISQKFYRFCSLSDPLEKKDQYSFNDFFAKLKAYQDARKAIDCPLANLEVYIQSLTGQDIGQDKWDLIWKAAALRNDIAVMLADFRKMLAKRKTLTKEIEFHGQNNELVITDMAA